MTWAKIDTALHRNPKVRMAGREARDVFLFVVLTNAEKGANGELNAMILDPDYLADTLQCSREDAVRGVKRCETFHLLHVTGDIVAICGWDDEWSVLRSTDRVRKHRAKQKQLLRDDVTLRNVSSVSCNDETPRKKERKKEKSTVIASDIDPSRFDEAWNLYPKKVGKQQGLLAAKRKITTAEQFAVFAKAIHTLAGLWKNASRADRQFLPNFSTFVSQERWLEELPTPSGAKDARPASDTDAEHAAAVKSAAERKAAKEAAFADEWGPDSEPFVWPTIGGES